MRLKVNSLSNNNILDWSKLKAFADDKINLNQKLKLDMEREEKIVGKGENAAYQHFLLFQWCFQNLSLSGSLKVVFVWLRVNYILQWIPLNCNPDNGDFRLFATFRLAPILFPFRQCKIHRIIGTLIKDIFGLLQQKSLHRLELFLFISNFGTYSEFK